MTKPLEQLWGVVGDKSPEDSDFWSITISTPTQYFSFFSNVSPTMFSWTHFNYVTPND